MASETSRHLDEPLPAQRNGLTVTGNQDKTIAELGSVQRMTPHDFTWKAELVEVIHFLHAKGWAPATSSNYSIRPEEKELFYVSSSGIDKGKFQVKDLMRVDRFGNPIDDNRKSSAETLIHAALYDLYPDARCVLHTHSVYNTVLSAAHAPERKILLEGFEILKGIRGIHTHVTSISLPVFPNSQDILAFSESIRKHHEVNPDMQGFLMAGHGLYTWGNTIAETKRQVEVFEFLFEVVYKLKVYSA